MKFTVPHMAPAWASSGLADVTRCALSRSLLCPNIASAESLSNHESGGRMVSPQVISFWMTPTPYSTSRSSCGFGIQILQIQPHHDSRWSQSHLSLKSRNQTPNIQGRPLMPPLMLLCQRWTQSLYGKGGSEETMVWVTAHSIVYRF